MRKKVTHTGGYNRIDYGCIGLIVSDHVVYTFLSLQGNAITEKEKQRITKNTMLSVKLHLERIPCWITSYEALGSVHICVVVFTQSWIRCTADNNCTQYTPLSYNGVHWVTVKCVYYSHQIRENLRHRCKHSLRQTSE